MNIHTVYRALNRNFRKRRMDRFLSTFHPSEETTILDVGGTPRNWELVAFDGQITLLNVSIPSDASSFPTNYSFVLGDGTDLRYADRTFDVGFSNSVIEHLYDYENQVKFARELRRVSKKLWVQTPARSFFLEPHLVTPFIHYLPKKWQKRLLRNFTVWGLVTRPSPEEADNFLREVRLLNLAEMRELFPDCEILEEKFAFLTKSYIAVRR